MIASRNALPPGYKLHWYVVQDVLGQGGFGITYLAEDTNLNHQVAIKEFLPVEMALREGDASVHPVSGEQGENFQWGLERFINEAQMLAHFRHNNIVRVFTVFSENNTAYMVMEYENGQGLHEILKSKDVLSQWEGIEILLPILDGLELVHAAGFIHRDIKPPNIFIRDDGSPVLLDFGSARQSLGEHTRTLTTMVSPGYAPFEQYVSKSDKQGPWTDIYGLGATMYRAVTGKSPPNAVDRSEAILQTGEDIYVAAAEICGDRYSSTFLRAIDHAMAFKAEDRPQNIVAWRTEIRGAGDFDVNEDETELLPQPVEPATIASADNRAERIAASAPAMPGNDEQPPDVPARGSGTRRIAGLFILVLAVMFITLLLVKLPARRSRDSVPQAPALESDANPPAAEATGTADNTGKNSAPVKQAPATAVTTASGNNSAASDSGRSVPDDLINSKQPSELISDDDRRRLALLTARLRNNPEDKKAERQLLKMFAGYESRVRDALRRNDLVSAEAYIKELQEVAPGNRKLDQALRRIEQARAGR